MVLENYDHYLQSNAARHKKKPSVQHTPGSTSSKQPYTGHLKQGRVEPSSATLSDKTSLLDRKPGAYIG